MDFYKSYGAFLYSVKKKNPTANAVGRSIKIR